MSIDTHLPPASQGQPGVVQRPRTRRRLGSITVGTGAAIALAACGAPEPGPAKEQARPVALQWWGYPRVTGRDGSTGPGANAQEWMDARGEEFKAKFPHATIEPSLQSWSEGRQKTEVAFAAGTPPDVYHDSNPLLLKWALKNTLEPLKGQFESKDYLDIIIKGVSSKGAVYAFPWLLSTTGAVINQTLVDEAGAASLLPKGPSYAWTIDEYLELSRRLKRGDVWGTLSNTGGHNVFGWFQAFGGRVFSEDGKKCTLNSPECLEG